MKKNDYEARTFAIDALKEVLHKKRILTEVVETLQKKNGLDSKELSFARTLILMTLRRLIQIDQLISHCLDKPLKQKSFLIQNLLRIGVCQLLFLRTADHAAVSTTVELAKIFGQEPYKKLINAILRRLQREGVQLVNRQDAARMNTPNWLWKSWTASFGEKRAWEIANANLKEAPLDISFKNNGVSQSVNLNGERLSCGTVRCKASGNVINLPGFKEGLWWIQDAAARQAVMLSGDVSGKRVIDLCAAPGGKTFYLICAGAIVTAVDRSEKRLGFLRQNLERLGLYAEVVKADSLNWKPRELADIVLIDAPCSATGTLRRHPDIAHLKTKADIKKLALIQSQLLDSAVSMLKQSGLILFCTCSLQDEEGPDQAKNFLKRHPQFRLDKIEGWEISQSENPSGMFRSFPSDIKLIGGWDGFFAARFVRR